MTHKSRKKLRNFMFTLKLTVGFRLGQPFLVSRRVFGSGSVLDPDSIRSGSGSVFGIRIRIRIRNPDPDPGGQKWPTKVEKNVEIL